MRRLFNSVSSTAIEAFYIETGMILPLRFTIIARRLMYLWTILQKSDGELVKQVYEAQKLSPVKNDWSTQVEQDLKYCKIDFTEEEIKSMKKSKFKKIVQDSIKSTGIEYLLSLKAKHSKSDGLKPNLSIQKYLSVSELTVDEKQLLFQFRTRTFNCRENFKNKYGSDLTCFACKGEDTQQHLLNNCTVSAGINTDDCDYEDIFGPVQKQIKICKVLKKIASKRNLLLKKSAI